MDVKNHQYDDIIDKPYPHCRVSHRMTMLERAAQFLPFDALTGYDEAVEETARITDSEVYLDENKIEELNKKLQLILSQSSQRPSVIFTFFVPDALKKGGSYRKLEGIIKKVDMYEKIITLETKEKISIPSIVGLECKIFENYEF